MLVHYNRYPLLIHGTNSVACWLFSRQTWRGERPSVPWALCKHAFSNLRCHAHLNGLPSWASGSIRSSARRSVGQKARTTQPTNQSVGFIHIGLSASFSHFRLRSAPWMESVAPGTDPRNFAATKKGQLCAVPVVSFLKQLLFELPSSYVLRTTSQSFATAAATTIRFNISGGISCSSCWFEGQ